MKSAPSIGFDVRPSRAIACATAIGVAAACVAPWQSALPTSLRVVASIAALAAGVVALRRFARPRFERVAYGVVGWTLAAASRDAKPAELVGHRRLGPWLALDFRAADRSRFRLVLGPDNSDADIRRRLALMLARAEIARPEAPV
jgi:toxin CptA